MYSELWMTDSDVFFLSYPFRSPLLTLFLELPRPRDTAGSIYRVLILLKDSSLYGRHYSAWVSYKWHESNPAKHVTSSLVLRVDIALESKIDTDLISDENSGRLSCRVSHLRHLKLHIFHLVYCFALLIIILSMFDAKGFSRYSISHRILCEHF